MVWQFELPALRIEVQPADRVRGPPPEAYKNSTDPQGLILVVNWSFKGSDNERLGSENDVQNIRSLFTQIGYRYESILDKTKDELFNALISFKEKQIHEGVDSLVCIFMSHGDENRLETSNGEFIDVKEIYHIFDNDKCVALAGKPKLFFFQHCRSKRKVDTKESGSQTDGSAIAETPNSSSYPSHGISDTYLCFSTERDSVSYRYPNKGSPFIEFLCRVFMKRAKDTRFFDLIPKVNYNLMQLDTPHKQRCEFTTIYHQYPFYFNPKGNPAYEQTANLGKTRQHPLGTDEETTMEKQSSVSRGASGTTSGARSQSLEGTETHRSHTECHTDSSLANETYGLNDYPRGYVYILNNLSGCNEDVWVLKDIFDKLGFEVTIMPEIRSYQSLKKKISEYKITRNATVLVFFFGFGYDDNLYFAENYKESVSFKVFIEAFSLNREEGNASILFTNTCFKSKSSQTTTYRVPKKPVWDTFHVCVKVNGKCLQGSILTKVLLQEFKENGSRQEFAEFSRHVTCKIEELQRDDQDSYVTDVRYYGVCKYYYFNNPSEGQQEKKKRKSTAARGSSNLGESFDAVIDQLTIRKRQTKKAKMTLKKIKSEKITQLHLKQEMDIMDVDPIKNIKTEPLESIKDKKILKKIKAEGIMLPDLKQEMHIKTEPVESWDQCASQSQQPEKKKLSTPSKPGTSKKRQLKDDKKSIKKIKSESKMKADLKQEMVDDTKEPLSALGDLLGTAIPYHIPKPEKIQVNRKKETHKFAAMGLETTGLEPDCSIIQITCSYLNNEQPDFNVYILPEKEINLWASEVNGLTFEDGMLMQNGKRVAAVSLRKGLKKFFTYVQEDTILISHSTQCFHSHLLVRNAIKTGMKDLLMKKVAGFSDSYQLFLDLYPGKRILPSHTLKYLVEHFSKDFPEIFESSSPGKENMTKIRNLANLINCKTLAFEEGQLKLYKHSSTIDCVIAENNHIDIEQLNLKTLDPLIKSKHMTRKIAKRIASSGLSLNHLELAYMKSEVEGLFELLNPRITKSRQVIKKIIDYFRQCIL